TLQAVEPPDVNQVMEKAAGTVERLDLVAADLHATMARIQRGEGSIGKLLTSDELYAGLNRTVSRMHLLAENLDASQADMRRSLLAATGTLDSLGRRIDRGQ